MSVFKVLASELAGTAGSAFARNADRFVLLHGNGDLASMNRDGHLKPIGAQYAGGQHIALTADERSAFVSLEKGAVLLVDLEHPGSGDAREVVSGLQSPRQLALDDARGLLYVVEQEGDGRLMRVSLHSGKVAQVTAGLTGAVGLAIDHAGARAYVAMVGKRGGEVLGFSLAAPEQRAAIAKGLASPFFLTWTDDGRELVLCEREPVHRVSLLSLDGAIRVLSEGDVRRPTSAHVLDGELYVFGQREIVRVRDIVAGRVRLTPPSEALPVASYAKLHVDVSGSPYTFDDLVFEVPDGTRAGRVSHSRDAEFDPDAPSVLLLAGSRPGDYRVTARDAASGTVVAEVPFSVVDAPRDPEQSPSFWCTGSAPPIRGGETWGSGSTALQNFSVPALVTPPRRRVAMILVATSDATFTQNAAQLAELKQTWERAMADSTAPSAARLWAEMSYQRFEFALVAPPAGPKVWGPVTLPGRFTQYFQRLPMTDAGWEPLAAADPMRPADYFWQAVVTAAESLLDWTSVDQFVALVNPVPPTASAPLGAYAWPFALSAPHPSWSVTIGGRGTYRNLGALVMPTDWDLRPSAGGRTLVETLGHELGHTLGLDDQYMPPTDTRFTSFASRDLGRHELMSREDGLPHSSLTSRMKLGWIDAAHVKQINPAATDVPVTETVLLSPVNRGSPDEGAYLGVEVRVADGRNYYFEYRTPRSTDVGDRSLPEGGPVVIGTDVVTNDYQRPMANRREVIALPLDTDGDGPYLTTDTQDYEERDHTDGDRFPNDFRVELTNVNPDSAALRFTYVSQRPDPAIRPWPGGRIWKSPDIEIRNARSAADPAYRDVLWAGHENRIVARIRNTGNWDARDVQVQFAYKDFTVSNDPSQPEIPIAGGDPQDVPRGPVPVEFVSMPWTPPGTGHYCVVARILPYRTPELPGLAERYPGNNLAQSNYTSVTSATMSPGSREIVKVAVANPFDRPARIAVVVSQSNALYRTYLERRSVMLGAGEQTTVRAMFEYAGYEELELGEGDRRPSGKGNDASFVGWITPPRVDAHAPEVTGGVQVSVRQGETTRFDGVKVDLPVHVTGRVLAGRQGRPVPIGGRVLLRYGFDGGPAEYASSSTDADGRFSIAANARADVSAAPALRDLTYLPAAGVADCEHVLSPPEERP